MSAKQLLMLCICAVSYSCVYREVLRTLRETFAWNAWFSLSLNIKHLSPWRTVEHLDLFILMLLFSPLFFIIASLLYTSATPAGETGVAASQLNSCHNTFHWNFTSWLHWACSTTNVGQWRLHCMLDFIHLWLWQLNPLFGRTVFDQTNAFKD